MRSRARKARHQSLIWILAALSTLMPLAPGVASMTIGPIESPLEPTLTKAKRFAADHPQLPWAHHQVGRLHYLVFENAVPYVRLELYFPATNFRPPQESRYDLPMDLTRVQLTERASKLQLGRHATQLALAEKGHKSLAGLRWEVVRTERPDGTTRIDIAGDRMEVMQLANEKKRLLEAQGYAPVLLSAAALNEHAINARRAFERAVRLDRNQPSYLLGLAKLFDRYHQFAEFAPPKTRMTDVSIELVAATYLDAHQRAFAQDVVFWTCMTRQHTIVSLAAGEEYVRVVSALGTAATAAQRARRKIVGDNIAVLRQIPRCYGG